MNFFCSSQEFSGEIYIKDQSFLFLNPLFVTNLKTQKTVLSDVYGNFKIQAQIGDIVRFTSIATERKDIYITKELLSEKKLIELKIAYREIEEVVLTRFKPTGNLKYDVLSLKTGEKKLKLKTMIGLPEPKGDGNPPILPIASFSGGGMAFNIESIYDAITGERKKKERLYQYEKMKNSVQNMRNYFGDDYFIKVRIPRNLIDNFLQFVYSSDNINPYLENSNFEAIQVYIEKYLPIYLKRLSNSKLLEQNYR